MEKLSSFDVISFDLFDTLILRPLDTPADLFFLPGEKLGVLNFKEKRLRAEGEARDRRCRQAGDGEVNLSEIWELLSADLGISAREGMRLETAAEESLCFADPLLLQVWEGLRKQGKGLIVTTDMYLPEEVLERILVKNGFSGYKRLFVSGALRKSKADGSLFEEIKAAFPGSRLIHVGDHPVSDGRMAQEHGLRTLILPNPHAEGRRYRTGDMSAIIGSAWRGIVNTQLYSGAQSFNRYYEYGFIYGGLFVLGYCRFIHESVQREQTERVLFLLRDGDILKQVYDCLYPGEDTVFCHWSRRAAAKLMAGLDREDYFTRFVYQRMNQGIPIREILEVMELRDLAGSILDEETQKRTAELMHRAGSGPCTERREPFLTQEMLLTDRNAEQLRAAIELHWEEVLISYGGQREAAGRYIRMLLKDCRRAAAVDIGWAGSGAMSLSRLAETEWKLPCAVRGIVAGTNTPANTEPDTAEPLLLSGRLEAYLYSQRHNRDLWREHDPEKGSNIFFELLLSSDTPHFCGFYPGDHRRGPDDRYLTDCDVTLGFGEREKNEEGIREIRRGILDFVKRYTGAFRDYPYMLGISGRDAYAPMLAAASHGGRYLRSMAEDFDL